MLRISISHLGDSVLLYDRKGIVSYLYLAVGKCIRTDIPFPYLCVLLYLVLSLKVERELLNY